MKITTSAQKLRIELRSTFKEVAFSKFKANIANLDHEATKECLAEVRNLLRGKYPKLTDEGFNTQFGIAFRNELKRKPIDTITAEQAVELVKIQNTKEGIENTFALIAKSGLKIISKKYNELANFSKVIIDSGKLCINTVVGERKQIAYNTAFDRYFTIQ